MLKLSLTSRLLHGLGCALIGSPDSIRMPTDFYSMPGDHPPSDGGDFLDPAFIRKRIAVNNFRRRLFVWVFIVASAISASVCVALRVTVSGIREAKGLVNGNTGQLRAVERHLEGQAR